MTKILNLSLCLLLMLHLWLVTGYELSHDEAYYWLFSNNLDWGYFDHPPFVAVLIRLFSFLPHSEFAVRSGFLILHIATCFLVMDLLPKRRNWLATVLFFSFPLASFAGLFALPDLPLLFTATLYCVLLKRFLEKTNSFTSVTLGLAIALMLYAKYHGILLVFFTVISLPKLFKTKYFYLVAVVALICFFPHVWWQYIHDFATLKYHFFERPKSDFSFMRLLEFLGTQIFLAGLFVGPIVWWSSLKNNAKDDFTHAMKFICFGTIIFFLVSTITKKFEANWTIFLTTPLIYLSVSSYVWEKTSSQIILGISCIIVILARLLLIMDPKTIKISRLNEFHSWKTWTAEIEKLCNNPILANNYQMASKMSFYLDRPVHALNYQSRKNQFDLWVPNSKYYHTKKVCYVTDKKQFAGLTLQTPEGKNLRIVPDFSPTTVVHDSP